MNFANQTWNREMLKFCYVPNNGDSVFDRIGMIGETQAGEIQTQNWRPAKFVILIRRLFLFPSIQFRRS